jgi:hypothetical protein
MITLHLYRKGTGEYIGWEIIPITTPLHEINNRKRAYDMVIASVQP